MSEQRMHATEMEKMGQMEDVSDLVRERWANGPLAKTVCALDRSDETVLSTDEPSLQSRSHKIPRFHMPWREQIQLVSAHCSRSNPSALSSKATWRFPVVHEYLNPGQALHGAAQSLFYDNTMAYLFVPIARPGFWDTYGFSRSLRVTYLAQAMEGEWVRLEVETVQVGKRMALLRGRMVRERDGVLVSTCEHDKFTTDSRAAKI